MAQVCHEHQDDEMNKQTSPISATEALSEREMTGLFSRAFSQPLKLLGQTEASLSSYAVFWCVAFNNGATQVEVANMTGLSAKTVSRVISQLGETRGGRGWIKQVFDESDRRVRRLSLSRKGKNVHARLMKDLTKFSGAQETA
jgi:DNA-binding MarR family transcriptional regulator